MPDQVRHDIRFHNILRSTAWYWALEWNPFLIILSLLITILLLCPLTPGSFHKSIWSSTPASSFLIASPGQLHYWHQNSLRNTSGNDICISQWNYCLHLNDVPRFFFQGYSSCRYRKPSWHDWIKYRRNNIRCGPLFKIRNVYAQMKWTLPNVLSHRAWPGVFLW